ncbi:MAG: IS66 family transposase [Candidatus Methanoperedens sp.]|nr:IS66 family transposase [Candidatus Methanoperedens sp.]
MTTKDYIEQLEQTIIQLTAERDTAIQRIQELERKNGELEKENEELKKKLLFYDNPHTPPSARSLQNTKKTTPEITFPPKKRGAPFGHRGATRPTKEPDEIVDVVASECENCGSSRIEKLENCEKSVIEDLPPPQKIKVTQYNRWGVKCHDCGHQFTSKHPDCPKVGNFGIFLLVYIVMLKFHLRGVIRKIQDFLMHNNDFDISVKGIHDILLRVGDACKDEYDRKIEKIRSAAWRYIDETGIKVNGKKWWLWIFRTNDGESLVVIRKSRGSKVLEEILGKGHRGPDIVDGWKAYSWIAILQRCWAHLLREVDDFCEISENGKRLSEEMHACFKALREFLDRNPSMEERIQKKAIFEKELENIVVKYSVFKELEKPLTYIRNGFGRWFTCLLYPGMEPTNNLGEQAMREHVILRKIIGCFRSENGAKNYQYIASLLATWRLHGKNGFEELEGLLRQELCLS